MNNMLPNYIWDKLENTTGESRADLCLSVGLEQYQSGHFEHSYLLSITALDIYKSLSESPTYSKFAKAYYGVCKSLRVLNRYTEAALFAVEASEFFENIDSNECQEFYYLAGEMFYLSNASEKALVVFFGILEDPLKVQSDNFRACIYLDVAFCLQDSKKYEDSVKYFMKARQYYVCEGEPSDVASIDEEIAFNYFQIGDAIQTMKYARSALDFAIYMNNQYRLQYAHNRMGLAKFLNGELEGAIQHLKRSKEIALSQKCPNWGLATNNDIKIAEALDKQGKFREALAIRKRIESVVATTGVDE